MKLYAVNSIFSVFLRGTAALISQISLKCTNWKMDFLSILLWKSFLWTLFWAIIPKYRKIAPLSGRQSPRDLVMGRGFKLSPCHTSLTATALWWAYKLCYTIPSILWHISSIHTMVHHTLVCYHFVLATFVPFLWHITKTCCQPYHETNSVCISLSL